MISFGGTANQEREESDNVEDFFIDNDFDLRGDSSSKSPSDNSRGKFGLEQMRNGKNMSKKEKAK